ncbi:hypothetical protein TI05_04390 [Achromatium sp. WMS3]|nr:hypothetical protein TI05_04390 [Achromatium sp. WMS3]
MWVRTVFTYRTLGHWILGTILLIWLLIMVHYNIGWNKLLIPWYTIEPKRIILLLILTISSYVLRAIRIYDYSYTLLRGSFNTTLRLSLLHNFLNNFLPMRLGELAYPILMQRYFGQSYMAGGVTLVWIRLLDLHFLGLLTLIFLYVTQDLSIWLWVIPIWLALIPILYWWHKAMQKWIGKYHGSIANFFGKILSHIPDTVGQFMRIWLWTALSWICKLSAFTAIVMHFSDLDLGLAALGTLGAELSSVLPIHGIAGAGTYELAMSAVLLPLGLEVANILRAAVNLHLYLLGVSLLLGGLGLLLPSQSNKINVN